jgi:hypothetical protein
MRVFVVAKKTREEIAMFSGNELRGGLAITGG